jgi:N-hydroxyarylamine O-acetyltransferase
LTALHTQNIPFENLDVLLERGVDLAEDAVFEKLVERRRGGYCFEQNTLFMRVLCALGFEVKPLSARGRISWPDRNFTPPRTHVLLQVTLNGEPWLTDVGMGANSLTAAIRFEQDIEQDTPHDTRRVVRESGKWFHQIRYGEQWVDVCEITGEEMPLIDRVIANWYTSTHPNSHFKGRMIVARAGDDGRRYTLAFGELKTRERNGQATTQAIDTPEHLLEILADQFGIHLPPETRFPL